MSNEVGGILSDRAILGAIERGDIEIDPFRSEQLNPVSYDLTLGEEVVVYEDWVYSSAAYRAEARGKRDHVIDGRDFEPLEQVLDIKSEPRVRKHVMDAAGFTLRPNIGYLMHTAERVHTKKYVPVLDGKSSIGRLFIQVHVTAGFGDPNFDGQYTLEVVVTHPVRVYPSMRVAQMRFHTVHGELGKLYDGNYVGDAAKGAVPSRAWRQFKS